MHLRSHLLRRLQTLERLGIERCRQRFAAVLAGDRVRERRGRRQRTRAVRTAHRAITSRSTGAGRGDQTGHFWRGRDRIVLPLRRGISEHRPQDATESPELLHRTAAYEHGRKCQVPGAFAQDHCACWLAVVQLAASPGPLKLIG